MERKVFEDLQRKTIKCFEYFNKAPVIECFLINPLGEKQPVDEPLIVEIDTGYDGHVLISEHLYHKLKLFKFELSEEKQPIIETASHEYIRARAAYGFLEIPNLNLKIRTQFETFEDCQEMLIGREILSNLIIIFHGTLKKLCIFK